MEFFVEPGTDEEWHEYWLAAALELVRRPRHRPGQPALLRAPEGEAVALLEAHRRHRVPVPLRRHGVRRARGHRQPHRLRPDARTPKHSGVDLTYFDQEKNERWTPYVIEPAAGLTRAVLAFLLDAYDEDEAPNAKGGVGEAHRAALRPAAGAGEGRGAAAVAQRRPVAEGARPRGRSCASSWNVDFDDAQAIGRRYRRQDEIGTPFCVTVDFDTLDDDAVTVRERDTMTQEPDPDRRRARLAGGAPARPADPAGRSPRRSGSARRRRTTLRVSD